VGGGRQAFVNSKRRRELAKVSGLLPAFLPSRKRAGNQRADHLSYVEALDDAIPKIRGRRAAEAGHDGALALTCRTQREIRLQFAVKLVEIGGATQQRKRA